MTGSWRPRYLSASAIKLFLDCSAGYFRRYVLQEVAPQGAEMRFGRSVHKGLEAHHRGVDPFAAFLDDWEQQMGEMAAEGVTHADLSAEGMALIKLYRADPLPKGQPELYLRTTLRGLEVPAVAYLDLVSGMTVEDYKTTAFGASWSQARADKDFQGAFYAAIWRNETGHLPEEMVYTVLAYRPRPSLVRYRVVPTDELADRAVETARTVLAAIDANHWEARCNGFACKYRDTMLCTEILPATVVRLKKARKAREASDGGPVLAERAVVGVVEDAFA